MRASIVALTAVLIGGSTLAWLELERPPAAAAAPAVSTTALDLAFYERRTLEDPWSAADYAKLAALRLQRGRERGGLEDYRRAEQAARRSLELRAVRNDRTRVLLASSLLAQHRFREARAEARLAAAADTADVGTMSLLGEIELELGSYAEADRIFAALQPRSADLALAPRLARWHELNGRLEQARGLLLAARDEARKRPDLPAEQVAWFQLRVGDFALRHGALAEARQAFEAGLAARPDDPRLLGALARVELLEGRPKRTVALVERAFDGVDLATLALAGDAWVALGQPARAERFYDELERRAAANPEPFNRQLSDFRVTHRRRLEETLATLEGEIAERPDMLGYDLLARALCAAGRVQEAARIRIPPLGGTPACARGALPELRATS